MTRGRSDRKRDEKVCIDRRCLDVPHRTSFVKRVCDRRVFDYALLVVHTIHTKGLAIGLLPRF